MQFAQKKKTTSDGKPFVLKSMKDVAELVDSSSEEEALPAQKTTTKSFIKNILIEARSGSGDLPLTEKRESSQQKKEEHARFHEESKKNLEPKTQDSAPSKVSTGRLNRQTLQNLKTALDDGTAYKSTPLFWNGDFYDPEDPLLPRSRNFNDYFYPRNKSQHERNSCQVSFCKHRDLEVSWDPLDPVNRRGSWQLKMKDYFRSQLEHADHRFCLAPNLQKRCKILAERVIQKYTDTENRKLLNKRGEQMKEPQVPPPVNVVEQEIRLLVLQMSRGKYEKLIESQEAINAIKDIQYHKEISDARVFQQAHREKHCNTKYGDHSVENLRRNLEQADGNKNLEECCEVDISTNSTPTMSQLLEDPKHKSMATSKKRCHSAALNERDRKHTKISEVKTDQSSEEAHVNRKQENDLKMESKPSSLVPKEEGEGWDEIKNRQCNDAELRTATAEPEISSTPASAATPPCDEELLYELMGIDQPLAAEAPSMESSPAKKPVNDKENLDILSIKSHETSNKAPNHPPTKSIMSSGKPSHKKRTANFADDDGITPEPSRKKSRKEPRSKATIEDSDQEADYQLPTTDSNVVKHEDVDIDRKGADVKDNSQSLDENKSRPVSQKSTRKRKNFVLDSSDEDQNPSGTPGFDNERRKKAKKTRFETT